MLLLCGLGLAMGYWIVHASFSPIVTTRPPFIVVIAGYISLISSLLACAFDSAADARWPSYRAG
jgi:hypothetical protein